jgi:hypothetical protein
VLELGTARRYSTLPAAGVAVGCCSTVGTDRLLREHHPALGNRPDVPGETQLGEGIQGRLVQTDVAAQPSQFIGREPEALQDFRQSARPAATRKPRSGGSCRTKRLKVRQPSSRGAGRPPSC